MTHIATLNQFKFLIFCQNTSALTGHTLFPQSVITKARCLNGKIAIARWQNLTLMVVHYGGWSTLNFCYSDI